MPVRHGTGRNDPSRRRLQDCIDWLKERPELWKDLPSDTEDVTPEQSSQLRKLGDLMKSEGLYASSKMTRWHRSWAIRTAIGRIRQEKKQCGESGEESQVR